MADRDRPKPLPVAYLGAPAQRAALQAAYAALLSACPRLAEAQPLMDAATVRRAGADVLVTFTVHAPGFLLFVYAPRAGAPLPARDHLDYRVAAAPQGVRALDAMAALLCGGAAGQGAPPGPH